VPVRAEVVEETPEGPNPRCGRPYETSGTPAGRIAPHTPGQPGVSQWPSASSRARLVSIYPVGRAPGPHGTFVHGRPLRPASEPNYPRQCRQKAMT
jgi:hypothetical protein